MGNRALRFGGKSGILPKPRQIFKQPFKHEVYQKEPDTGYAEGVAHPPGISRDVIRPKVFTPEDRLAKTVAKPKKQYNEDELAQLAESRRYKIKNASLRRQYLKESYEHEVKRLEKVDARKAEAAEKKEQIEREAEQHEQSWAELYTIPTVEQYLKGPLVRPRTDEEKEALALKRKANRLSQQMLTKQKKAQRLLELYNASSEFAITESKLETMVNDAFSERKLQEAQTMRSTGINRIGKEPTTMSFDNSLKEIILGTVNQGPTYEVVEDTLSGFTQEIYEDAATLKEQRKELLKQQAEEKQKKMQELQDSLEKERKDVSN